MAKRSRGHGRLQVATADSADSAAASHDAAQDQAVFFAAALHHVADMVVICDAAGRHVFVNPAARALALTDALGAELDAVVWGDWFDADDQPLLPDEWPIRLALRGSSERVEREMYRRNADGTNFWLLLSAATIRDAAGAIIGAVATAKDISARKQAEADARALKEELARRVGARTAAFEELQRQLEHEVRQREHETRQRLDASELLERSRRMLQAILDRTAAVIYVKDTSFRYLLINAQYERIFDVTNAAVAGRTDYEIFPPEFAEPLRVNDARVLGTDEVLYFEEVVPQLDGLHTYLSVKFALRDEDGVVYAVCGISTDITERKRMEAELRRSQATLATVIDSGGDAIFLIDRHHHLVMYNAVLQRLFASFIGAAPSVHTDLRAQVPVELAARWHDFLDRALSGEPLTVEESLPIDGVVRHFLMSLNPIAEDRQVTGVTVFAREITALRRAEDLARRHQAELAHVLRQHTISAMAANLAHEINQPLGAIANYAQGSLRRLSDDAMTRAEIQSTMAEIARQALRAGKITRRVRELMSKEEPNRTPADVNDIVRAVLEIVAPTAQERGVGVRCHQGQHLPAVTVDHIQIEQVVLNLLLNALDAVRETAPAAAAVEIRTAGVDAGIEVAVSDNGTGIDQATREQMFEPFFTTKPGGLGMGLAISRAIIEAHDGRLWASSNPAGGTTLHFFLPAPRA